MYCIIKCTVQRKQARVKNADLRHPSCTVFNVKTQICVTRPQCVKNSSVALRDALDSYLGPEAGWGS